MAKSDLRKLNRAELLELLIAQTERADRLSAELAEAREQLKSRERLINQAGDLAGAAAQLLEKLNAGPIPQQRKGTTHETKGFDISAIAAITSGIGKGKI